MAQHFLPRTDAGLLLWANAAAPQISAAPTDLGLTAAIATSFESKRASYATALGVATSAETRTRGTVAAKNVAREALRREAMMVAALVQAHPGITPQQLEDLQLTVRDREPTPVPPPATAPLLAVLLVIGNIVRLRLFNAADQTSRARPPGSIGATILSHVGENPPSDLKQWKLEGSIGRTTTDVIFPTTLEPGTKVWMSAYWFNFRKQAGPMATPISANLPGGSIEQVG